MKRFDYTITDPNGLHARPAGLLVKQAQLIDGDVMIECRGKSASMKRLLAVMGLGVRCGDVVTVTVEGSEQEAEALKAFFRENF